MGGGRLMMKGGLGSAAIALPNGLVVAAIVATNGAGDVIDPKHGAVVAGVRTPDGKGSPTSENCCFGRARQGRAAPGR